MIDHDGFRPNVGIILTNHEGRVFWGRRYGQKAWQFPQGGIGPDESPEQALYRELGEETGLTADHVQLVGSTRGWLRYRLPRHLVRRDRHPPCIGQKQRWFLLRLVADEHHVALNRTDHPEFDHWRWVDYWHPLREVVFFKRKVYERALRELAPLIFPDRVPAPPSRRGGNRRAVARAHGHRARNSRR